MLWEEPLELELLEEDEDADRDRSLPFLPPLPRPLGFLPRLLDREDPSEDDRPLPFLILLLSLLNFTLLPTTTRRGTIFGSSSRLVALRFLVSLRFRRAWRTRA